MEVNLGISHYITSSICLISNWRHQLLRWSWTSQCWRSFASSWATCCGTCLVQWFHTTTLNDSFWIRVRLCLFQFRNIRSNMRHLWNIIWLTSRHFLWRRRTLFLSNLVDSKATFDHRHFFVIFSELSIEIIIINFIEKCNTLSHLLIKMIWRDIKEVIFVERYGSHSCINIVVNVLARCIIWTQWDIFCNQSDYRFWFLNEFLWKFEGHFRARVATEYCLTLEDFWL